MAAPPFLWTLFFFLFSILLLLSHTYFFLLLLACFFRFWFFYCSFYFSFDFLSSLRRIALSKNKVMRKAPCALPCWCGVGWGGKGREPSVMCCFFL
ncbi:uncharacterized protein K452DRAFT_159514 [Aplosporella prunicola CBS 121167]|uniref:Uncharacterized protein n=1 Tax=Aplosporella prunicola CBS 121167 TaxID=1176127 RepID=A0A6A6BIW3_9PEZI|nr:uncharacterized protein K452DRAFT_159514 [Aplosporella prunicola CBS 121167]KAF2143578.1 hypothetical protein K452DRAFT_159514 [Aplosporella prunicola CBS 121167]